MRVIEIKQRPRPKRGKWPEGFDPLVARLYEQRGLTQPTDANLALSTIVSPHWLPQAKPAAERIWQAIVSNERIVIVGDYDCDGATSTAVAVRGLRMFGAQNVGYVVPDREKHGYGLSPLLVDDRIGHGPGLLITVDNGVAAITGVAHAKSRGWDVVVTDHHLQGDSLPADTIIVNPNLRQYDTPTDVLSEEAIEQLRSLAGVGVMFYVLLVMRKLYMDATGKPAPPLHHLLDLVAIGLVADLVPLSNNNRKLVKAGLHRMLAGQCQPGVKELIRACNLIPERLTATDIGFGIAPKLNAAGRLENMEIGIETLITDDSAKAKVAVMELVRINAERKDKQKEMTDIAMEQLAQDTSGRDGVVGFDPSWHAGIIGLVASKLKDTTHRPAFAFARSEDGTYKASGRSIPGYHLRDALVRLDASHPGMIAKFGGHAMAAGLTLASESGFEQFKIAFQEDARRYLTEEMKSPVILSDGSFPPSRFSLKTVSIIDQAGPWGQGFPLPCFDDVFNVMTWREIGTGHLKLFLMHAETGESHNAIAFNVPEQIPPPPTIRAVYRLEPNHYRGETTLQLVIEYFEAYYNQDAIELPELHALALTEAAD